MSDDRGIEAPLSDQLVDRSNKRSLPLSAEDSVAGTSLNVSNPLALNAEALSLNKPYIQILELPSSEIQKTGISALFLFDENNGIQKPLGHITFNWRSDNLKMANLSINHTRTTTILNHIAELPQNLVEAIKNGSLFNAFELNDAARGKGLGKLLWLSGLAHMRDLGFEKISITGDHTIEQNESGDSFYMKYGAYLDPESHIEVVDTDIVLQYSDYLQHSYIKD